MSTFNGQIASNPDNPYIIWGAPGNITFYNTAALYGFGPSLFFSNYLNSESALRYTGITIPKGATINSASINIKLSTTCGGYSYQIWAYAEDNSSQISDGNDFVNRSRTSATVQWNLSSTGSGTIVTTQDVSSIIQEIVNRSGWSSGNTIQFVLGTWGTRYPNLTVVGSDYFVIGVSYNGSYYSPLTINYSTVTVPTVTTGSATSIANNSATLGGNITNTGGENNTVRGFQYGLDTGYGSDVHETGSYGTGAYTLGISSLNSNTTYHFRAYSTNSAGTSYGSDQSFTTTLFSKYISVAEANISKIETISIANIKKIMGVY